MTEENNKKSEAALREERVLEFWRENKTFEKSLKKNSPRGHYVFYDGPPFATGQIHYGHILGSTAKDVIGRYKTMQGFYVPRKWGWDCHGLPIENIVEKELGISGHKEIEKLGIDKFVEYARSKVLEYDKDWEKGIERIGRWVDFKGSYKTMDNTFIESVWWALGELNKKNLIYEGVKVLAYCARCETPIANSEIAMDNSYKDIADISIYVKFELEDESGTYLVAWTTTPWTLPGNTAIAINKDIEYVKVKIEEGLFILAKETLANVLKNKIYEIVGSIKGQDLVGKKYKPVFPYYQNVDIPNKENIWRVWHADFVTTEKGTGIAHEAPAFGEEDSILAKANNIPMIVHVDVQGRFVDAVTDFKGLKVKPKDTPEDKDAHLRTDIEIIKYLQGSGAYFDKEKITHSYPHCMRCDTPIIYYALPSYFISITKEKSNIIKQADNINWIPSHLKEGRFKNIVENAPDWNISRNRYWASPLPIWKCDLCKEKTFVNSLEDLKSKTKKSGNKYFVMRHGGAENNALNICNSNISKDYKLTEEGEKAVENSVSNLLNEKIDIIYTSPFLRTKQTAQIVGKILNLKEEIIEDNRLREYNFGDFDGKQMSEFLTYRKERMSYDTSIPNGESLLDAKKRFGEFLYEIETKHKGKNILIVTHGIGLESLPAAAEGANQERSIEISNIENTPSVLRQLPFVPLPHNHNYELDLHRPYIDQVELVCTHSTSLGQACGGELERIKEVLDCWFESGSMPFAQDHYPFQNKDWQNNNFPAGFIAEYIAQTRTWFYYTHAVSTMLFGKNAFKNVVTTGTLRAEDGEKMSKSKQNYPDPWIFIDKYGVDALRIYLMSSTLMKGEDANFAEKAVQDIASKIVGRFYNVLAFYELYRDKNIESNIRPNSKNILDTWIMERLDQVIVEVTVGMEKYDMAESTRPFDLFIDDLSTWYLRRSRERIKDGDMDAKKTLYFVLKTISKLFAPFAPFMGEDVWQKLKKDDDVESVHLTEWPKRKFRLFSFREPKVLVNMEAVRSIVTLGLEARQKAGIKVRQPLNRIDIVSKKLSNDYIEIIKDELNIKNVNYLLKVKLGIEKVDLDVNITPELKQEGDYRELVRALQDMRKKMGLTPSDIVNVSFDTDKNGQDLIRKFEVEIKKVVLISKIIFEDHDLTGTQEGHGVKIDDLDFRIRIVKI